MGPIPRTRPEPIITPLFLNQTEAWRLPPPPPLSQGLDDHPTPSPLSENLGPPLYVSWATRWGFFLALFIFLVCCDGYIDT